MYGSVRLVVMLAVVIVGSGSAWAQETGIVTGTASDETGGVLPGASVNLRPSGAQRILETVTDGAGAYRFENVPVGPAELTFRLINFSTVRRTITVTRGGTVTANALMLVATSADIVVTAPRTFRNLAEIDNPAENLVGVASAGSEGAITAAQLAVRPVNRAAEVLETVPGMVISQHSGEGKANQYYLRGFSVRVGAGQRPVGKPEQQGQVQRRRQIHSRKRPEWPLPYLPGISEPLALDGPDSATRHRQRLDPAVSGSSRKVTAARRIGTAASSTGSDPARTIRPASPDTCSATVSSSFTTSRTSSRTSTAV